MNASDKIVKRYKFLFKLPKPQIIILYILIESMFFGIISNIIVFGFNYFLYGISLGIFILFLSGLLSSLIIYYFREREGLLNFKRILGLTFFSNMMLGLMLIVSALFSTLVDIKYYYLIFSIGCGTLIAFIFTILYVLLNKNIKSLFLLSFSHPFFCFTLFLIHLNLLEMILINEIPKLFVQFIFTLFVSFFIALWYVKSIDKVGIKNGIGGTINLFKAFAYVWYKNENSKFEEILDRISEEKNINILIMKFFDKEKIIGAIIIPEFHFGPFRKMGSSIFPSLISEFLERKFNAIPLIFHPPSTHEEDLVKVIDNERLIKKIEEAFLEKSDRKINGATPLIKEKIGNITIYFQLFNNYPLVLITRSPIPTEDIPTKIRIKIKEILANKGFKTSFIVDSHNCINKDFKELSNEDEENIYKAILNALEKSLKLPKYKIEVGFSQEKLEKYSELEGIGKNGIVALVMKINDQKIAYISIDGNNMIKGLREKIIEELTKIGFNEVEVTTTDTHIVTGLTRGEGYFPIGAAVPNDEIINSIIKVTQDASSKLKPLEIEVKEVSIEKIKVLGKSINILSKTLDESINVAKKNLFIAILTLIFFTIVFILILY
ncbi:MAG: DUF2070 family protein [Nitrososphaerota archaeon]